VIVADLAPDSFRRTIKSGLRVRVGPIVVEMRSQFAHVHSGVALHYAAHEIVDHDCFADFRVSVDPAAGVRRWIVRQAAFGFENGRPFQPLPAAQAFPLLEWGLNWCVAKHCHQYAIIHAAVVERSERALVMPAPPGSGKSTLCAALVARGWRLLSDELALIRVNDGRVVPLPRPISLKNQSIASLRRFWPDATLGPTVPDTQKGAIAHLQPPAASVRAAAQSAAPGWIVLPHYSIDEPMELAPVSKGTAFMHLVDNAFNYDVHGRVGFALLADFVEASRCYTFTYNGDLKEAIDVFETLSRRK
jgi:HprK-related kinase A